MRVDDQKWELVPVLITKNRLLESIGGLYKKTDKLIKIDKLNLYKPKKIIQACIKITKKIQVITTKFIQVMEK